MATYSVTGIGESTTPDSYFVLNSKIKQYKVSMNLPPGGWTSVTGIVPITCKGPRATANGAGVTRRAICGFIQNGACLEEKKFAITVPSSSSSKTQQISVEWGTAEAGMAVQAYLLPLLKSNTQIYYGIHATDSVYITVDTGDVNITMTVTAEDVSKSVYVYDSGWHAATPYVYANGKWNAATAYVWNNGAWQKLTAT